MKTLEEIKKEVAIEMNFDLNTSVYKIHFSKYTSEIAKRYAIEVSRAALENAANNATIRTDWIVEHLQGTPYIDKMSITDERNIPKI